MSDQHLTRPPQNPTQISFLPLRFGTLGFIQALDNRRLFPFFDISLAPERIGFAARLDGEIVRSRSSKAEVSLDKVVEEIGQLR
jgi:hypothetical protein